MAALTKVGTPSLASMQPPPNNKVCDIVAGEAIAAWDACYIKSDGKAWRAIGTAVNAAAVVVGFAAAPYAVGQPVTLFFDVEAQYATGMTPGAVYYLSGSVAGGLDSAVSTGANHPVAIAKTATVLLFRRVWDAA